MKKINSLFSGFLLLCFLSGFFYNRVYAEELGLSSGSAALIENSTGKIIYEKNSHERRPAASVMKVMTLLLAMEAIDLGRISCKDMVTVSDRASEAQGADVWLKSGETCSVEDLIKAIALVSANDASIALAEYIAGSEEKFISMMNERASQLGMNDTVFKDCVGDDIEGNLTSANDIAIAASELIKHPKITLYTSTWIDHLREGQTQIVNTNKLIKIYQGITGLKTGTTKNAGSCIAASAERDGLKLVAVVLGASDSKERYKDAAALLDYGFGGYMMTSPKIPDNMPKSLRVKNGMIPEVDVSADMSGQFLVPKGKEKDLSFDIKIDEDITAPIVKGQSLGKVIYKSGQDILSEYDITALHDVEEIGFVSMLKELSARFLSL